VRAAGEGDGWWAFTPRGHQASNVPKERLTDDSIKVRQVTHHQFSFVVGSGTEAGRFTLQMVLDQGAWEEVVSITAENAEVVAITHTGCHQTARHNGPDTSPR
jgi:hypothetical protein